jgi:hypothetical protein
MLDAIKQNIPFVDNWANQSGDQFMTQVIAGFLFFSYGADSLVIMVCATLYDFLMNLLRKLTKKRNEQEMDLHSKKPKA